MSTFAIVPWEDCDQDRIFDVDCAVNRDHVLEPYLDFKKEFERRGHTIHTIDLYREDYSLVDYFLFFEADWVVYKKIRKIGKTNHMVWCKGEPPCVCDYNTPDGYKLLKHVFPYILTYYEDWTDNEDVFFRTYPVYVEDQRKGNLPYSQKKLTTAIVGNKNSDYPGELYSERRRAIAFFEEKHPQSFDFYGVGWDEKNHKCYHGVVANKAEIYHQYKFAICYENLEGLSGFVDEKVIDCLTSGIVPIYCGSDLADKWIPKECCIYLRDFHDYDELYMFLEKMDEDQYNQYLKNASEFLRSKQIEVFSGGEYARCILKAISKEKPDYRSSYLAYKLFRRKYRI